MAYDNGIVKVISVPISLKTHKRLLEIATKEKRSKTAQASFMLEQQLLEDKAE